MTDNEIIKALECRVKGKCPECPYFHSYPCDKCKKLDKDALDLINRLQAENEKLKKAKYIFSTVDYCADDLDKALKENEELKSAINGFRGYEEKIKAEAYKEYADKFENRILSMLTTATLEEKESICTCIGVNNNLLKEMVGEGDG